MMPYWQRLTTNHPENLVVEKVPQSEEAIGYRAIAPRRAISSSDLV